tara:strand:- start:120 stop:455 length:336 start_codon:yes stop_codon:yes gene_type:complete
MKKYIIIMFVAGIGFVLGQALKTHEVEIESIVVGIHDDPASGKPQKKEEIPVAVTLTKYQLEKMLNMIDHDFGYGGNASPQDSIKFTSIAKKNGSDIYNISSTHLARRPTE